MNEQARTNLQPHPKQLLSGVRVADFSAMVAGGTMSRMLVDAGADVIKIELAPNGELLRGAEHGGLLAQMNRGKRAVCVNYHLPKGRRVIEKLVGVCDVAIENFSAGVIEKHRLGYQDLSRINPSIIMCSISGFGQQGPYKRWPANDVPALAMGGFLHMIGEPDDYPAYPASAVGDHLAGVNAYAAILGALYYRSRTGEGQYIDISMIDAVIASHDWALPVTSESLGAIEVKRGGRHRMGQYPFGSFRGPGGRFIAIGVNSHKQWVALANAMGHPELAEFDNQWRIQNPDALQAMIEEWLINTFSNVETAARELAENWHIPCGPVWSVKDIVKDSYLGPKNTAQVTDYGGRRITVNRTPHVYSKTPVAVPPTVPRLGEHDREILSGLLGYTEEQYQQLLFDGVMVER